MRNLKRVLSLALATVMLLGMMVIGAGAADEKKPTALTDLDKVTNKEAVALTVDLKIIEGKPDGTFDPAGIVDRATMAKLVYKVLMGTADESTFKGVSTPLADIKGTWAEGFINYCYSMDIVAGVGDGKFNPSGKVTVASAAKMLLVALGYDPAASKYEGDIMWSVNIMRDAQKAGLLTGIAQASTEELTRDNAAQMIYNALGCYTVKPDFQIDQGIKYLKKYDADKTTLGYQAYSMVKLEATVGSISSGKAVLTMLTKDKEGNLVSGANYGKLPATANMVGNKVSFFAKASLDATGAIVSVGAPISTTLAYTPFKLLGSSTDGAVIRKASFVSGTDKDLTTKDGKNKGFIAELPTDLATVKYYLNGEAQSWTANDANDNSSASGATANNNIPDTIEVAVAKSGAIVELFDSNKSGLANIIRVTNKTVDFVTGTLKTGKNSDGKDTITIPGVVDSAALTTNVVGYADLVKGSVVLTYALDGVTYIETCATVDGVISGVKNSTYKVDNTYYALSGLAGSKGVAGYTANDYKNTYTLYLDNNKNIVDVKQVTDEAIAKTAVVLDYGIVSGSGIGGTSVYQAQLLKDDATVEIVTITKFDSKKIINDPTPDNKTDDPADTATTIFYTNAKTDTNSLTDAAYKNIFVNYKTDKDGKFELTPVKAGGSDPVVSLADIAADKQIFNNTAKFDGTNIANAKTLFLVKKGTVGKETYAAYTGIANVPAIAAGAGNLALGRVVAKDTVASMVFLSTVKVTGDASGKKLAYIFDETSYETVSNGNTGSNFVFDAVVDGVKTTLTVDTLTHIQTPVDDKGFIEYTTTDGIVTSAVAAQAAGSKITAAAGGVLVIENGFTPIGGSAITEFVYNADTIVTVINGKTAQQISGDDIVVDNNDQVAVKLVSGTKNNTAAYIYIVKVA